MITVGNLVSTTFGVILFFLILERLRLSLSLSLSLHSLTSTHAYTHTHTHFPGKHTNFELGTRVPMIIRAPGISPSVVDGLVESVDLYPTIAELAGLSKPDDLDGINLESLMTKESEHLKDAVFSEYPRCPSNLSEPWSDRTSCVFTNRSNFTAMGYSVRTKHWRYTVWLHWDGTNLVGDFDRVIAEELYEHQDDDGTNFDRFENVNVVDFDKYSEIRSDMLKRAKDHWSLNSNSRDVFTKERPEFSGATPVDQFELWSY